ncbi:MAG: hypothetical protein HC933_03140 [Pleurocapsa sp. SU_196_0]|nr:hypothetical protein [Pleurocapsa sp. SU_196_0]
MKRFLSLLALLSVAFAAPGTGTVISGQFNVAAGENANLRFEFKLAQHVLFNRAGSSLISFTNPFTNKPVELEVSKGKPYPNAPEDYLESLDALGAKLSVPAGTKAGVYRVSLEAEMFLCEGVLKVCYREVTAGKLEVRVGGSGRDVPVRLEFARPGR